MSLNKNINKIKHMLNNSNVLDKLEERYCYATDALNADIESRIPDLVVFVETIEEVQQIVRFANKHKIPIISRGAGTNMVGACVCQTGGIVINFSKMNKILEINSDNMIARVQPGVVLGELKKATESVGLFYPPDPSNFKVSTIGGSIAQSSGGALAFKYGTTKDYVLSLKVVTANGDLVNFGSETIKDACGYHLAQLMIGSEGTLGIIVEATLKLIPLPPVRNVISAYFETYEDSVQAVNNIISSKIFPAAIDFMDKTSIFTVEEFAQKGLKTEFQCMLIIEIDGQESYMKEQIEIINNILLKNKALYLNISNLNDESNNIWEARRLSFAAATRLAPDVLSDDIIVPRENLIKMINKCNDISKKYNLKLCLVGHIGDGNLHPQFVLNLEDKTEKIKYIKAKKEMYEYVQSLNGRISAEHGIGIEKLPYLKNTIDEKTLEFMKSIKRLFDPNNILNPGKIFEI